MSQVGQVLEDYTNWLYRQGRLRDITVSDGGYESTVAAFLEDYDKGKWLPNTDADTTAYQPPAAGDLASFLEWLRSEGFQVPRGHVVQKALAQAFLESMP